MQDLFAPAFANPAGSPIRELFPYMSRPGFISFAGGYPSPSLFDTEGIAQAVQRTCSGLAGSLQYGATEGLAALKEQLLLLCARRGVTCSADEMLVTTGSQQAFDLLVRVFVQPGDMVLLEAPAYPAAIQALRLAGAVITEVPMDVHGLQVDRLEDILRNLPASRKPKLLYSVPTFSNPRGTLLAPERRGALIALAHRYGFIIVEDDPYGELSFTDAVPPTLYEVSSQAFGQAHPVVYLSSLSKTVAPALRVGWMVAPPGVVRRCAIAKQTSDLCSSPLTQRIAAEYLMAGRYPQTVATARAEYRRRAQAMQEALVVQFGQRLRFDAPQGGMFFWVEVATPVDPQQLFEASVEEGVLFVPGRAFYPGAARSNAMRLSFAGPDLPSIVEGIARLDRAFTRSSRSSGLPSGSSP